MKLIIDKNSAIPVYFQIMKQIKDDIHSGVLKPNAILPSERELCDELRISRMTVKQAMDSLMNEGLIFKKKGVGTFVSSPKIAQPLSKLTSFTNDMISKGMKPGSHTISISVEEPSDEIKEELRLNDQDKVIYIKRLRLADGEPMAVETSFLRYSLCYQMLDEQLDNQSLYEVLKKKCNLTLSSAIQIIEVATCTNEDSKLLKTQLNKPIFFIKRVTYDDKNIPVEYVESVYRSDRYKFQIELKM